jgi:tRNA threonylcarbamoyladenosine biosynthesis protein TsaB
MLLALDTSTRFASLALHDGRQLWAETTWYTPDHHTTELAPQLAALLTRAGQSPNDLNGVAVALGPGSFTGLRVGLALAKGLVLAQNIPLLGIPTLDVLASAQPPPTPEKGRLCAVLEAGRGRICAALYRWQTNAWRSEGEPLLTTWEALAGVVEPPVRFCGEIDAAGGQAIRRIGAGARIAAPALSLRRAGYLADLAWRRLKRGDRDDPATLAPIYLNQPET